MPRREKVLLNFMLAALAVVLLLFGVQSHLDQVSLARQDLVKWQKTASTLQRRMMETNGQLSASGSSAQLAQRILAAKTSLDPMALAQQIRTTFARYNVNVEQFQVLESDKTHITLKYTVIGPVKPFLDAAQYLLQTDSHLLVTRLSMAAKEHGQYSTVWEVGYAALP